MDPYKILDEQYQTQLADLEGSFTQQENMIREQAAQQYDMLAQRYNLERKYVEQTPMDWEQRRGKIQDLNKKYEMKALELDQKVQPFFQEVQSKKMEATLKLNQGRQARQTQLQLIDRLVQDGIIKDPNAAIQAQARTVGVSMPIGGFRGPSREAQIEDLRDRLRAVNEALSRYEAGEERWWRKDIPLGIKTLSREGEEISLEVTSEQRQMFEQLLAERHRLESDMASILTQQQTKRPGLHQFSGPAARVAANRSRTFQGQAAQLLPQQKPQPTPDELRKRGTQEAYQQGVALGYWN